MLDFFHANLSFFQVHHVEIAGIIREILPLNTSFNNFLVVVFHAQIWYV